jgi:hypothetical protein
MDESAIPDFQKELSYFAKTADKQVLTIDHLLKFTIFDNLGNAIQ